MDKRSVLFHFCRKKFHDVFLRYNVVLTLWNTWEVHRKNLFHPFQSKWKQNQLNHNERKENFSNSNKSSCIRSDMIRSSNCKRSCSRIKACFQEKGKVQKKNHDQTPTHSDVWILQNNRSMKWNFLFISDRFVFRCQTSKIGTSLFFFFYWVILTDSCVNCLLRFVSRAKSTILDANRWKRSSV